jgi:glucose-6-phosphate 1-dehydrogenase
MGFRRFIWNPNASQVRAVTKTETESARSAAHPFSGCRVPPASMVIFGAGGDLTKRLVVPALYHLAQAGMLPDKFAIIGIDHKEWSDAQWHDSLGEMMKAVTKETGLDAETWAWLRQRMHFMPGDFTEAETFDRLKARLKKQQAQVTTGNALFYLAVADRFFCPIIEELGRAGLAQQSEQEWRRVIVEKPFGHDLPSAKELNARILKILSEDQIYRIDHFLGKETVQNVLVLRFANGIFEPLWSRDHIDHVQITAAEIVGVEGRAKFYERTGALRDMVPNHLFQLLATIAMEPPISFDADAVRAKKTEVFRAIQPVSPQNAVRGQYGAGLVQGQKAVDYRKEPDVASDSATETYVAMKLGIDNWRWAGVPFYLRTGKHLPARTTEIAVQFKQAPYALFRDTPVDRLPTNVLKLRIQPNEGLSISFSAKRPGPNIEIDGVAMNFSYSDYFEPLATVGYETLIYDCLIGDATLFQRADSVEAAWFVVQDLLDFWAAHPPQDFPNYASGSAGPDAAARLLERDGRAWLPISTNHAHKAIRNSGGGKA